VLGRIRRANTQESVDFHGLIDVRLLQLRGVRLNGRYVRRDFPLKVINRSGVLDGRLQLVPGVGRLSP
jgi:hypothetical protein